MNDKEVPVTIYGRPMQGKTYGPKNFHMARVAQPTGERRRLRLTRRGLALTLLLCVVFGVLLGWLLAGLADALVPDCIAPAGEACGEGL